VINVEFTQEEKDILLCALAPEIDYDLICNNCSFRPKCNEILFKEKGKKLLVKLGIVSS
jgi:hypothetical protein